MSARRLRITLGLALVLALVTGCASIDYDYPRTESRALTDTNDTQLGRIVQPIAADKAEGESGFLPIRDGINALAARLMLANRAERSIDVQYYLIKNDIVGRAF
ncbi:MAG: hypothetical protein OES35_06995, partial [Chromatiales bacterium]|nr:hypothetical protein [Chromatiales bacterium]